jgi:hypothetical protein
MITAFADPFDALFNLQRELETSDSSAGVELAQLAQNRGTGLGKSRP